ncbi:MAG: hypothetical protein KDD50_05235 [Bdellovibrionales bacterium]|nr:hypothetical protein [Bdellovibrionales bacterium]MCB0413713.1 hypothetical protein [Bdellovibrionales bacterium]
MIKSFQLFMLTLLTAFSISEMAQAQRHGGHGRPDLGGQGRPDFGDLRDNFGPRDQSERFIIDMRDEVYRGRSTVGLKALIQRQYGRVNLEDMELQGVQLMAKSAAGRGSAALYVGGRYQDQATIDGRRGDFENDARWTFNPSNLRSFERGDRQGRWELELNGNVKIRQIIVMANELRDRRPEPGRPGPGRPQPGAYVRLKEIKADKGAGETRSENVRLDNVQTLRITGLHNTVEVEDFVVVYGNGQRERLSELTGYVRDGEVLAVSLNGRNVISYTISCRSPGLFDSEGKIEIGATVARRR